MREVAIIGAGPAGVAAAVQCRRYGLRPLLLDAAGRAGGLVANGFCVENYPGVQPVTGTVLAELLQQHLARFRLEVIATRVRRLSRDHGRWRVVSDRGDLEVDAVIVATGTEPRRLELGVEHWYEVRDLLANDAAPRRVSIIGGGEAACDYGLSLAQLGARVDMLVRGARLRACLRLRSLVEQHPSIRVYVGTPFESRPELWRDGNLVLVAVGRESTLPALLAGHGVGPGSSVATGVSGLWIAGDARAGSLGQVGTAVGDGLRAARHAWEALGD